nr:reverse transcriptase domain-containing protein [Tanacetum cinerariifolium]
MADQRTMVELLCAPTEGYAEAIVVPPILAEHFKLKHSLINMMTLDQFFRLEKDNPHDHIRCSKETPRSILTWEDLVSKFINEFFSPSRMINLRNEISKFQQHFDESFHEAWYRYKDLLRACPYYGFTELHQLDTFYNAFNLADQDSLNSAAGGNILERRTQDVLTIIENKSKEMDSILEDSVDECNLANPNNDLVDTILEMFTDEHTLDYSSQPLYDDVDDDLLELEFDNDNVYDDPFDSKEDKIKVSKLLIDELDPSRSSDFLPSMSMTRFSMRIFLRILTSKGVHTSLLPELSHRGPKAFKVINIFKSPMEIFPCSYGEDIRILDVPCLYFYPP